jgi:hypothetical protein
MRRTISVAITGEQGGQGLAGWFGEEAELKFRG